MPRFSFFVRTLSLISRHAVDDAGGDARRVATLERTSRDKRAENSPPFSLLSAGSTGEATSPSELMMPDEWISSTLNVCAEHRARFVNS